MVQTVLNEALNLAIDGRYGEAAERLLDDVGVKPSEFSMLGKEKRRMVYLAANYLTKANDKRSAAELYRALGEYRRAAALMEEIGDPESPEDSEQKPIVPVAGTSAVSGTAAEKTEAVPGGAEQQVEAVSYTLGQATAYEREGKLESAVTAYEQNGAFLEAGRILAKLGRPIDAADICARGGHDYEAATLYLKSGDLEKGVGHLLRVSSDHERYRSAATLAILISARADLLSSPLDAFVERFVSCVPRDDQEEKAFRALRDLYERYGLFDKAMELQKSIDAFGKEPNPAVAQSEERISQLSPADIVETVLPLGDQADSEGLDAAPVASTDPAPAASFEVGTLIDGRYRLDSVIGRGGAATVYEAYDTELEERIGLKVFERAFDDPHALKVSLERFKQEVKLNRRLRHRNIIQLYHFGSFRHRRYITMELLRGCTLTDLLDRPMDYKTGIEYLIQICAGLQAAHHKNVIHRDIKPDNLFVVDNGEVKIMDFGVAKHKDSPGLTVTGVLGGTPAYMAPEQVKDFGKVTSAVDQYSLGVVAYQMFTATLPFQHREMLPLLIMHVQNSPPPPSQYAPDIPQSLEKVVLRMLSKKPSDRFPSCLETSRALRQVLKDLP